MSKPVTLPEWASSVSAAITEPTLLKKQTGWVVEAPAHDYFNWWQNLVFQWTSWLNAFESTAHTWSALQTFGLGLTVSGAALTVLNGADIHGLSVTGSATVTGGILTDSITATAGATLPAPVLTLLSNPGVWATASGHPKPTWWKDYSGAIHVEGYASASLVTTGFLLGTLPAGSRPASDVSGLCRATSTSATKIVGSIEVNSSGQVFVGSYDGTTNVGNVEVAFVFHPSVANGP